MHLSVSSTINNLFVFNSLDQNTESIVQWSFSLIKNVLTWSSQNNSTGLITFASWKLDDFIFTNQDLLDGVASTKDLFSSIWVIKSRENFSS